MSNQKQITDFIKSISGQSNILTIPRIYIDITGDHLSALFLSQCIYWSDKGRDGWFYKSDKEWLDELGLSSFQIKRIKKDLEEYIETDIRKANGAPTTHYRVNFDAVTASIIKKLNNPLLRNSQIHCVETNESLTETTTKITNIASAKKSKPVDLLDGMLAYQRRPTDGPKFEWLEEYLRPLAEAFWKGSGIEPFEDEKSHWRKELRLQWENGFTPAKIEAACKKSRSNGLAIKSPASIRAVAKDIAVTSPKETPPPPENHNGTEIPSYVIELGKRLREKANQDAVSSL